MTGEIDLLSYSRCVLTILVLPVCDSSLTELAPCLVVMTQPCMTLSVSPFERHQTATPRHYSSFFKKGIRSCYVNPSSHYLCA